MNAAPMTIQTAPRTSAGMPVILLRLLHGRPLVVNPLHPRPIAAMPTAITATVPSISGPPVTQRPPGFVLRSLPRWFEFDLGARRTTLPNRHHRWRGDH